MRALKNENFLFYFIFCVSFIIGIFLGNIFLTRSVDDMDMFSTETFQIIQKGNYISLSYFFYVLKTRAVFVVAAVLMSFAKWKKMVVPIVIALVGYLLGNFLVNGIIQSGFLGIIICVVMLFPHVIFYGAFLYVVMMINWKYPDLRFTMQRCIFCAGLFIVGVLVETFLNPFFVKAILYLLV